MLPVSGTVCLARLPHALSQPVTQVTGSSLVKRDFGPVPAHLLFSAPVCCVTIRAGRWLPITKDLSSPSSLFSLFPVRASGPYLHVSGTQVQFSPPSSYEASLEKGISGLHLDWTWDQIHILDFLGLQVAGGPVWQWQSLSAHDIRPFLPHCHLFQGPCFRVGPLTVLCRISSNTSNQVLKIRAPFFPLKGEDGGWGDSSAVKSTGCSSKGPGFHFQHTHGGL